MMISWYILGILGVLYSLGTSVVSSNDVIATDFKRAASEMKIDVAKDASFDCWLDALSKLEYQLFSNDEAYEKTINSGGVRLSPGGNFCAYMKSGSGAHLDALAFELTKCEYEKFSEPLPTNCSLQGRMASGTTNEESLRNCMQSLPKDTWFGIWTAFTQYKLSTYNLCMKLTDELMLHRQKEAAYYLERQMFNMKGQMDEVLQKADTRIEDTINLIRTNVEDIKHDMKEDVNNMIHGEMENVQQLHKEIKGALNRADDKLEATTRKLEDHLQNTLAEFYQTSGLKRVIDFTSNIKSGSFLSSGRFWNNFITLSRSLVVLTVTTFLTKGRRVQRARPLITFLVALKSIIELNLNYLASIDHLVISKREKIIHSLRFCDFMVYFAIIGTTFLASFILKKDMKLENNKETNEDNICISPQREIAPSMVVDDALNEIRAQLKTDQETRRREAELWKRELIQNLNLQNERLQEERFKAQQQYNYCAYSTPRVLNPRPYSPSLLSSWPLPSHAVPTRSLVSATTGRRLEFSPQENSVSLLETRGGEDFFCSKNEELSDYDTCSEGGERIVIGGNTRDTPIVFNGVGKRGRNGDKIEKKRKALVDLEIEESKQSEFESAGKKQKN